METTNEATYNFGKEEYTKKNLTPTQILDLAFAYTQTPITKVVGKKLDDRIKTANDVSRLTGMMQLEPTKKSGKPALVLHLLKNSLVTKDEYITLYKELVEVHKSIVKYLKNASPERRNAAGAAKAAAKDMRGEFDESVNEEQYKVMGRPVTLNKGKKSTGVDWTITFQNGKSLPLADVLTLIKPFPKGITAKESKSLKEFDADTYRKKQDFVIGRKFAQVASDADVELMARLKKANSEHSWQLKQNISSMDHLYKKYKIRSKKGVEEGIESVNEINLASNGVKEFVHQLMSNKTLVKKLGFGTIKDVLAFIKGGTIQDWEELKMDAKKLGMSINEGHFGEIDIMAQNANNFKEFVKDFYKEYKDFPKDRDTMKWLESLYKSRANEGLDSQGLERAADGLPQTEEEPSTDIFKELVSISETLKK